MDGPHFNLHAVPYSLIARPDDRDRHGKKLCMMLSYMDENPR
jgi:hypothetical protein